MSRTKEGAWILDHSQVTVQRALWQLDQKDIYGTGPDSVETIINQQLFQLVNRTMFADDDGAGSEVSEL